MRFAIISDLHFGESENYGKINPESGLNTRLEDIDRAFNCFIDYVLDLKNKINVAIIGGDLYKSRKPTPTQQWLFTKGLIRLLEHNKSQTNPVKVIIFTGNHDVQRSEMAHAASSVAELTNFYSDTLWIEDKPKNYTFNFEDEKVLLCTVPYLCRQKLEMRSNEQVVEFYGTLAREALGSLPDATCKVLVGHQMLEGCAIVEYQDINSFNEIIVPLDIFNGYDFVSQAHNHRFQILKKSGPIIVHQGNPLQLEFDEICDKGFIVYDTRIKKFKREIIKSTKFVKIEIDVSEDAQKDATEAIKEVLIERQEEIRDAIVKIKVVLKESDLPIRSIEFKELLREARFLAPLEKKVVRANRVRNERVTRDNSLKAILTEIAVMRGYEGAQYESYINTGLEMEGLVEN